MNATTISNHSCDEWLSILNMRDDHVSPQHAGVWTHDRSDMDDCYDETDELDAYFGGTLSIVTI